MRAWSPRVSSSDRPTVVVTGRGLALACRDGIEDAVPRGCGLEDGEWDRTSRLADMAATGALTDAHAMEGDSGVDPERMGSTISASKLGLQALLAGLDNAGGDPLALAPAAWWSFFTPRLAPPNFRGPVVTSIGACATGLCSWIRAAMLLQNDEADLMLAGSAEGTIHPLTTAGFRRLGVLSKTRPRPFDRRRDGFVPAEGAGVAVLERESDARARDARVHARLLGWAQAGETGHAIATPPDGLSIARLIERALRSADTAADEVAYIHLHGTGTRNNDQAEAAALRHVWDEQGRRAPASSTKALTGHCLGAAGAVETLLTIGFAAEGTAPGTFGLEEIDPACVSACLIRDAEPLPGEGPHRVLVLSYGFGGAMAGLVLEVPILAETGDALCSRRGFVV